MLQVNDVVCGKYKIVSELGHGGMSVVYLALDEKLNKTWAIKVAVRSSLDDNNTAIQNLTADKNVLIQCSHPNLPRIVDVFDTEDSMMIVMDYIEGKSLSATLREYGAQQEEDVIRWGIALCDVLRYLHSKGMIYRDLKPDNIMLKPNGEITLIDFGTVKQFKEEKSKDTVALGTKGYAAPEQGVKATRSSDIYNLGATLRHLITGIDPQDPANINFTLNPIREINPSLSEGLEYIITRCLSPTPAGRYKSADELMFDLENYKILGRGFRAKLARKLIGFVACVGLTVALAGASAYCYAGAQSSLSKNYELKLSAAADVTKTEAERRAVLIDAIATDASREDAYLSLVELFLASGEETGSLSRDESSVFTHLRAGIDVDGKNSTKTIVPLDTLKAKNPSGYEKICYEIGVAFWYDYEVENDRYTAAAEWLSEATGSYPIAQYYVGMGQCQKNIKKYKGQNRTEEMYDAYLALWEQLCTLNIEASQLSDNDTRLLVWNEIVSTINAQTVYFHVRTGKDELLRLLTEIRASAEALRTEASYDAVRESCSRLLTDIDETVRKVGTVTQEAEEAS